MTVLLEEQRAAAAAALAEAIAAAPELRLAVARTYTPAYWREVHGGAARLSVARRQARYLVCASGTGWAVRRRWRTSDVLALAAEIRRTRDFGLMPVLADALEEAGCDDRDWLALMRDREQPWLPGARVLSSLR